MDHDLDHLLRGTIVTRTHHTQTPIYSIIITKAHLILVTESPLIYHNTDHVQIDDDLDHLARGSIVIRTHHTHKHLYIPLLLLSIFGPDYYVPP